MFLWCHGKQSSDPTIAMCNDVPGTCLPKNLKTSVNRSCGRSFFLQETFLGLTSEQKTFQTSDKKQYWSYGGQVATKQLDLLFEPLD